jgi:hypothetical protein
LRFVRGRFDERSGEFFLFTLQDYHADRIRSYSCNNAVVIFKQFDAAVGGIGIFRTSCGYFCVRCCIWRDDMAQNESGGLNIVWLSRSTSRVLKQRW